MSGSGATDQPSECQRSWWNEQPGLTVAHGIADATHVGCYDRSFRSHRFDKRVRESLGYRAQYGNIEQVVKTRYLGSESGESHHGTDTDLGRQLFQRVPFRPLTNDYQSQGRPSRSEHADRAQQRCVVLYRQQ